MTKFLTGFVMLISKSKIYLSSAILITLSIVLTGCESQTDESNSVVIEEITTTPTPTPQTTDTVEVSPAPSTMAERGKPIPADKQITAVLTQIVNTKRQINKYYYVENNKVYYDPGEYLRNSNSEIYKIIEVEDADPATFINLFENGDDIGYTYVKDKNNIYYGGTKADVANPKEFRLVPGNRLFAMDDTNLYYTYSFRNLHISPLNFKMLSTVGKGEIIYTYLFKVKDGIFSYTEFEDTATKLVDIYDPKTLEPVPCDSQKKLEDSYYCEFSDSFFYDSKYVYYIDFGESTSVLQLHNVSNVGLLQTDYGEIKNIDGVFKTTYSQGYQVIGVKKIS